MPRAVCHRIRFNSSSGASSYSRKSILADCLAKGDFKVFLATRSTSGVHTTKGVGWLVFWKQLNIGVAPAAGRGGLDGPSDVGASLVVTLVGADDEQRVLRGDSAGSQALEEGAEIGRA